MTKMPSDMTPEERKNWIAKRKLELLETVQDLETIKKLEEDKLKQELYDLRVVRRSKGKRQSRGLGDTVEKVISKVTGGKVKPCGGCKKRRDALNKMVPYKENDD